MSERLDLITSPEGQVYLDPVESATPLSTEDRDRLVGAFERSTGDGLFALLEASAGTPLPEGLSWARALGREFFSRLCGLTDLETVRERFEISLPSTLLRTIEDRRPPIPGAEYLNQAVIEGLWRDLEARVRQEFEAFKGPVNEFITRIDPAFTSVGRVHLNLAENKDSPDHPFAFLATYTISAGKTGRPQHRPLGLALREFSQTGETDRMISLLRPVHRASSRNPWFRLLVDSGALQGPVSWTPAQAYEFLKEAHELEACGLILRIPDWWRQRARVRPQVQVSIGDRAPSRVGLDAMLDFSVSVVLDGQELTPEAIRAILEGDEGLIRIKGNWVEVDRERLAEVLIHWEGIQADQGGEIAILDALRLLSGADNSEPGLENPDQEEGVPWAFRRPGSWLAGVLEELSRPPPLDALDSDPVLGGVLRPYQKSGVSWLWRLSRLGIGGCLADDMGLGKTIQVLAFLKLLRDEGNRRPHLLVVPASLMANWQAEIERFTPDLTVLLAHPSAASPSGLKKRPGGLGTSLDLVITTYGYLDRIPWARSTDWGVVVLDEAQAIKNPKAGVSRHVREIRGQLRIALTGTPIENRLLDLWSLFDFINPGLLGSLKTFKQSLKRMNENGKSLAPLRTLVTPYILRRLKTDRRVIDDLPDKIEMRTWYTLTPVQARLYQNAVKSLAKTLATVEGIQRKGLVLAYLTRFKQILNHPAHYSGDQDWSPELSGKFMRLRSLCEEIASRQEKVLVFTQYRELTDPLAAFLETVFEHPGLVLHGSVAVGKRRALVDQFQGDPRVRFFILSLKAGGTGLNLTAACHVIHFDRWWNPAVESQATDRAFRIGQKSNVMVHKLICRGTIEEKIDALIRDKEDLAREVLGAADGARLTELNNEDLLDLVRLDLESAVEQG